MMVSKPLVVALCLDFDGYPSSDEIIRHFYLALDKRAEAREALTALEARRYLTGTVRPHAVAVLNGAVVHPQHREILFYLVEYAKAGGTVVFGGGFGAMVLHRDIDYMFKDTWDLPWKTSLDMNEEVTLNLSSKGLDVKELTKKYKVKAKHISGVAHHAAVYLPSHEVRKLVKGKSNRRREVTYQTSAAFTAFGKGRIGYIGDMVVGKGSTSAFLAMCFHPALRAPEALGTGNPLPSLPPQPTSNSTLPASYIPMRNVLIISLEKGQWTDDNYVQLFRALRTKADLLEAFTTPAAVRVLTSTPPPDAILISDAAITNHEHQYLLEKLISYAQAGGTVVLGVHFSSSFSSGDARAFFEKWGVPWDAGSYHRTTFAINPSGIPAPLAKDAMFPTLSMKALHVKNATRESAVYLPTERSRVESLVFAPTPVDGEESPAVFARVGRGYLGYVGDVNAEQGSLRVLIEMCGVKIQPGDMGLRSVTRSLSLRPDGTSAETKETEKEIPLPVVPPLPQGSRERDAEVAVRAERRAKVREEKREVADALKDEGNDLFRNERWAEAADMYRKAALIAGPQPVYLSNLAAALLKSRQWETADSAASRALMYDPKHVKSLYRRGLARKELGRLQAALNDLECVLDLDPRNGPAFTEQKMLETIAQYDDGIEWACDESPFIGPEEALPLEDEDESDSEDFTHEGNGRQCKFHNRSGCRHGIACRFKHAPDSKSVRDELGRNVCVYWLLGWCRFDDQCIYAHDKTYLPTKGWWTGTARLAWLRESFENEVSSRPLPLPSGTTENILAEALKPVPWRRDLWATASFETRPGQYLGEDDGERWDDEDEDEDEGDEDWDNELEERAQNLGFTNSEVEEMLMYGVKPWDDDAQEAMAAIHAVLDDY